MGAQDLQLLEPNKGVLGMNEPKRLLRRASDTIDKDTGNMADWLVRVFHDLSIEIVFGVPGGAIEPFYNALARGERAGLIQAVTARHESGAAFMADGYARETGKIGVCCATTGPGSTNLITGVAAAYADKIGMLVITGQTAMGKFGQNALQDSSCSSGGSINTVEMLRLCTVYSSLVSHPDQMEAKVHAALRATKQFHGPAHLSIPSDIFMASAKRIKQKKIPDNVMREILNIDEEGIKRLLDELKNAKDKNIVLYLGHGCGGGAMNSITNFAELTNASIITGPMGKRWADFSNPRYQGVFGFGGHTSANDALKNADLIIAVGSRLGELSTGNWSELLMNEKLIHIDDKRENLANSSISRLQVLGDIKMIFDRVNSVVSWGAAPQDIIFDVTPEERGSQIAFINKDKCLSDATPIKPQRLMHDLSMRLPENARVLLDAGNAWSWGTHYLHTKNIEGYYRMGIGYGSMGWAVGAAIGTGFGVSGEPVFCITGDGSYLMSGQEITVAIEHKLPIVFIILNDSSLGMVRHGQELGGAESIGHNIPKVDFALMAKAVGAHGIIVRSPKDLSKIDYEALSKRKGPTIIDVRIDPDEVPPMGNRVEGLQIQKTPGQ